MGVFDRKRGAGLKLSPKKCNFLQKEVNFLGHVSGDGVAHPSPKITSVCEWEQLHYVKQVHSFLGLASYQGRFIPSAASSLTRLTDKDAPFDWTSDCTKVFEKLKSLLTSATILAYPRPGHRC